MSTIIHLKNGETEEWHNVTPRTIGGQGFLIDEDGDTYPYPVHTIDRIEYQEDE